MIGCDLRLKIYVKNNDLYTKKHSNYSQTKLKILLNE